MSECKYKCGTKFGRYDSEKKKYYEEDNKTLHTWERHLEVLKSKKSDEPIQEKQDTNDLSVEVLLKKLASIGIDIRLDVLRNTVNGVTKK